VKIISINLKPIVLALSVTLLACCSSITVSAETSDILAGTKSTVVQIADDYLSTVKATSPFIGYWVNYDLTHHNRIPDNSLTGIQNLQTEEDKVLQRLLAVNDSVLKGTPEAVLYVQMLEALEANIGKRICKSELWNVNHMEGFQAYITYIAKFQPVGNERLRKEAIERWSKIGVYFDTEIFNLRLGLSRGYSAPKVVVSRVIKQLDGLLSVEIEKSPLLNPVTRDDEPVFKTDFATVIAKKLRPSMLAYRQFLVDEYYPKARDTRALSANPDGAECYQALYRSYTTLKWLPDKVHTTGEQTVSRYEKDVIKLGKNLYGITNRANILKKINDDPSNRFNNAEEMHDFFETVLERAVKASPDTFTKMPATALSIKPYPDHIQGSGRNASYEQGGANRAAIFRYDPTKFKSVKRGGAEVLSVHEGFPGHHMQVALVQEQGELHPVQRLFGNSAFAEGWARYAEALAEEMNVYETDFAKISRRAWPARGMVSDTGLHVLGWSADKTHEYLAASGRFKGQDGIDMMDRMAAIPAQLTSYDSGALEIFSLRQEAKAAMGSKFSLKVFHNLILKNGEVPLWFLREQIEEWISENNSKAAIEK
jgi:uncharacterized protein (DUF885 family)